MVWLVLGMLIAVLIATLVVGIVTVPARRAGRFVLTPRGERAFRVADERARAARTMATRRRNAETREAAKKAGNTNTTGNLENAAKNNAGSTDSNC